MHDTFEYPEDGSRDTSAAAPLKPMLETVNGAEARRETVAGLHRHVCDRVCLEMSMFLGQGSQLGAPTVEMKQAVPYCRQTPPTSKSAPHHILRVLGFRCSTLESYWADVSMTEGEKAESTGTQVWVLQPFGVTFVCSQAYPSPVW